MFAWFIGIVAAVRGVQNVDGTASTSATSSVSATGGWLGRALIDHVAAYVITKSKAAFAAVSVPVTLGLIATSARSRYAAPATSSVSSLAVDTFAVERTENTNLNDNFNRASLGTDYTAVANPWSGSPTYVVGEIRSSTTYWAGTTNASCALVEQGPYENDQWLELDYHWVENNDTMYLGVNMTLNGSSQLLGLMVKIAQRSGGGDAFVLELWEFRGTGVPVQRTWNYITTLSPYVLTKSMSPVRLRVERIGGFLIVYVNGTMWETWPLSSLYGNTFTGGQPCLIVAQGSTITEATPTVDNLEAGDFTSVSASDNRHVFPLMVTAHSLATTRFKDAPRAITVTSASSLTAAGNRILEVNVDCASSVAVAVYHAGSRDVTVTSEASFTVVKTTDQHNLLLEDDSGALLLETGDYLLLESA